MNKPTRILTASLASLAVGGMSAYDTMHKNGLAYQSHPVVAILTDFIGSALAVFIFYFGYEWFVRRKEKKLNQAGYDKFYDEVAREIQERTLVAGLWTKAYAEMGGDEAKARALYIKYRVAQLIEASRQQLEEDRLKWTAMETAERQQRAKMGTAEEQRRRETEALARQEEERRLAAEIEALRRSPYNPLILIGCTIATIFLIIWLSHLFSE